MTGLGNLVGASVVPQFAWWRNFEEFFKLLHSAAPTPHLIPKPQISVSEVIEQNQDSHCLDSFWLLDLFDDEYAIVHVFIQLQTCKSQLILILIHLFIFIFLYSRALHLLWTFSFTLEGHCILGLTTLLVNCFSLVFIVGALGIVEFFLIPCY